MTKCEPKAWQLLIEAAETYDDAIITLDRVDGTWCVTFDPRFFGIDPYYGEDEDLTWAVRKALSGLREENPLGLLK